MSLHHNPKAESRFGRAPVIICDGGCGRKVYIGIDGRVWPEWLLRNEPYRDWKVHVTVENERFDFCPDCKREK